MHNSIPSTYRPLTMYITGSPVTGAPRLAAPRPMPPAMISETRKRKTATAATEPRAWAAIVFGDTPDVVGATRRSERLHWSRKSAQKEAEEWLGTGPIAWQRMGEWMMLGRVGQRIVVVTGVLLPKGDPP